MFVSLGMPSKGKTSHGMFAEWYRIKMRQNVTAMREKRSLCLDFKVETLTMELSASIHNFETSLSMSAFQTVLVVLNCIWSNLSSYQTKIILKRSIGIFILHHLNPEYYLAHIPASNESSVQAYRMVHRVGFESIWTHNTQQNKLIHHQSDLCLTANTLDWTLMLKTCNDESYAMHQDFFYDASSNELIWKHPNSNRMYIVYLSGDTDSLSGKCNVYIAVNSMDLIGGSVEEIATKTRRQRLWRMRAAYCLSKYNHTSDLNSETINTVLGDIESFSYHNVSFGLMMDTFGRYIVSDGCQIKNVHPMNFLKSDHKYYGLWHVDDETKYLMHYLSGKYVSVINPNTVMHKMMRSGHLSFRYDPTHYYRYLHLTPFSIDEQQKFVRVYRTRYNHRKYQIFTNLSFQ